MSINIQLKNLFKLLLVGAVLFVICSTASWQASKFTAVNPDVSCGGTAQYVIACAERQVIPESPGYVFVDAACVNAAMPPTAITPQVLGAIIGDARDMTGETAERRAIIEYEVEQNDTLSGLAQKFDITTDTIAWANNLDKVAQLKPGQKLIIPPVNGVIHYAVAGDTIDKIAQNYQGEIQEIIAFNELSGENDVFIGDVVMIPDGKIIAKTVAKTVIARAAEEAMPDNYFLCPVGGVCKRTQGLHFRNAVDLTGGYCGAPIYAAASGTVIKTKTGWNGGAGLHIVISHMSGAVSTRYYHLASYIVSPGQEVRKGDIIGYMGDTGNSTGCHLHFEVIGAANPF